LFIIKLCFLNLFFYACLHAVRRASARQAALSYLVKKIGTGEGGVYASIVKEINLYRPSFNEVSFTHQGRKSNVEAHSLAPLWS
jgi:hypothetical protein